jgi:hypothetical protein
MITTLFRRALFTGVACLFGTSNIRAAESLDITTLYHAQINPLNAVHPLWTPVQHYRGKTFFVTPDVTLRPMVTEIDDSTGKITTVYLDSQKPDYHASTDGHNRFTLGIDPDGYIHVTGDMHGYAEWASVYVERYQYQNMMYWKSNKPLDVTGGFTFAGGAHSASRLPGIEWGGDSRFFNDKNGALYFSARVRAFNGSHLAGSEPQIAYGVYHYNNVTGIWDAMGGMPNLEESYATDRNKVLYWEWTMGFEAYQSDPRFDSKNRLHFSIGGNTGKTGTPADVQDGSALIYGYSDDFGKTWKKTNGTNIELPIRSKDGDPKQGDLIVRSRKVAQQSEVYIDKDGKIAINVEGEWKTYADGKWVPFSGGVGLLGPDGMLVGDGSLDRSTGIGQPTTHFETNFGQVFSFSELGLQDTGAVYGVGLPAGTNFVGATEMWVFKAVFGPTENVTKGATATASSGTSTAELACDGKPNSKWVGDAAAPGWLEYNLPSKSAVCRYEITSVADVTGHDPKEWDFEGSDDGTSWTTLDSQKNQIFMARNQTKIYPVENNTAYPYYRLNIKSINGNLADGIQLAELKLLTVDASVAPAAPKIFFAQGEDGKVWLSWTQPEHASTYTVKRARLTGPATVIAKNVTDPGDFLDATCANGMSYKYTVSAVNSTGESPDSDPVTVTPHPTAPRPPIIQTAVGANEGIVLNWLPLWPEATSFNVKRSDKAGGPYKVIAVGVPGLTYTDVGLTNDTPYYYVVSASSGRTESPNSREITGTPFRWVKILHYHSVGKDDLGTASASSENASSHEVASSAFDGILNNKWLFPVVPAWLQYKFADGTTWAVTRYQLISCQDGQERDPADWQFQGSTDGTSWVTLDTQKDQKFAQRNQINSYAFENPNAYQYYRLNVTRSFGNGLGALAELVLWADGPVLKTPPPRTPFPSAVPIVQAP